MTQETGACPQTPQRTGAYMKRSVFKTSGAVYLSAAVCGRHPGRAAPL